MSESDLTDLEGDLDKVSKPWASSRDNVARFRPLGFFFYQLNPRTRP
jgi:hypothetical protein